MRTLKAILVDDEKNSREALEFMLQHSGKAIKLVARCKSADEAVEQIQLHHPDLVCLDIEMPGKDGFEVLNAFEHPDFKVIIITGYEHYALKAIKHAALDFVLKPIELEELVCALNRVERALELEDPRLPYLAERLAQEHTPPDKIILSTHRGFKTVAVEDILFLEASQGNYSTIYLSNDRTELVTKPLNHFEELLCARQFFRVHRSFLVNLSSIRRYQRCKGELAVGQDKIIAVAARRRGDFYKAYQAFLQ